MTDEIENVQRELYKVIDDGGDPGPLTLKLSELRKAAGLVNEPPPEDSQPKEIGPVNMDDGGKPAKGTFRYTPSRSI